MYVHIKKHKVLTLCNSNLKNIYADVRIDHFKHVKNNFQNVQQENKY